MIFFESLAKELYPQIASSELSTTCLCTSNPVYLVFSANHSHPEIAIRISESDSIFTAHDTLVELHQYIGDLVPEPLTKQKHGSKFISVQKGLKGMPWFQLAGKIQDVDQWNRLRAEAASILNRLHQGIQSNNSWQTNCNPGEELRQCYRNTASSGIDLPAKTGALVDALSAGLDRLGTIPAFPQHGDFCLNNLIIEDHKMHIIDFEDFGMTCMPLYDQFTLALSTYQLAPQNAQSSLAENIDIAVDKGLELVQLDKQYVPGFFMYHLLLRLGEWSQNRLPYRKWLLSILQRFTDDINIITK